MSGRFTSLALLVPLGVVLAAGAVTASTVLSRRLALDASRVLDGELWRLFSGHLAHLTWRHFVVDALAFWLLFSAYAAVRGAKAAAGLALAASLAVSLTVVALGRHPIYGGLSGLSCGAFAALALAMVLDEPNAVWGYTLAVFFCGYLWLGESLAAGVRVATEAHCAGALTGAVFEVIRFYRRRTSRRKEQTGTAASIPGPGP